jgi:FKBP-type peptidyl-prolyl cis-trans isomerase
MKRQHPLLVAIAIILIACSKPSPQLPSNKGNRVDLNREGLLAVNKQLAMKEDSLLRVFAQQDINFKKNELGFWYKVDNKTNGKRPKEKDICAFSLQVLLLNNRVVQKTEEQIEIGKKQTIVGLEEGLKLMHRGESATFVLPWYLAYGMLGYKDLVPAYTSIVCRVHLYR